MNIKLVVADNCKACDRAKAVLENIKTHEYGFNIEIVHINAFKGKKIFITPALLIDDKLYSYGDIDEQRLLHKIGKC